jgi:hypothetical protein
MMLMMTALSLVSRSNSAAVASANESRAQAARMAAEFGLNQLMARVNTPTGPTDLVALVDDEIDIDDSPPTSYSYTIRTFDPPAPPDTPRFCPDFNADDNLNVTIEGTLTDNTGRYTHVISSILRVCVPPTGPANQLRVRAVR